MADISFAGARLSGPAVGRDWVTGCVLDRAASWPRATTWAISCSGTAGRNPKASPETPAQAEQATQLRQPTAFVEDGRWLLSASYDTRFVPGTCRRRPGAATRSRSMHDGGKTLRAAAAARSAALEQACDPAVGGGHKGHRDWVLAVAMSRTRRSWSRRRQRRGDRPRRRQWQGAEPLAAQGLAYAPGAVTRRQNSGRPPKARPAGPSTRAAMPAVKLWTAATGQGHPRPCPRSSHVPFAAAAPPRSPSYSGQVYAAPSWPRDPPRITCRSCDRQEDAHPHPEKSTSTAVTRPGVQSRRHAPRSCAVTRPSHLKRAERQDGGATGQAARRAIQDCCIPVVLRDGNCCRGRNMAAPCSLVMGAEAIGTTLKGYRPRCTQPLEDDQ